ncbi:MAG: 2-C-methyl-D-erythritol 2,4-cyclodiphosphate synthase [Synergistaceae bacterium]|jgi:2-C-methyl-D-erythritol 4-phosphate cytidylyltransferase/2-C-methyl-D-erythritol 2,4-cyclodiphosphate synthase|nr:2-C-methyl-D-erythritol 2,4-cyclodiphosphate synthase [Synergistaceae bacterium]
MLTDKTDMNKSFSFLIVAGGSGSRIGGLGKQFRSLGENKPLWRWSVELALSAREDGVEEIVLVLPQGCELGENWDFCPLPVKVAFGGATRTDSVRNGLAASTRDYVMVHDAARPFADGELLRILMAHTAPTVGAIPVLPVAEAIKRVDASGKVHAVDRDGLYATQTPQSFFREALIRVLTRQDSSPSSSFSSSFKFKDEAEAWLAAGMELRCVEGRRSNFKVTWPEDLELAEALATHRGTIRSKMTTNEMTVRTGIGYDVHRLVPEKPLILGGVVVPSPLGLLGHSDADVLGHAVADALLGAAGLPDIGNLFPASDERYENADSMELLRRVVELVKRAGWAIVWVDAVVEAQIPRLNPHLPAIGEKLSEVLNSGDRSGDLCVNVKAKSAEKTDDPGAGKSMVCHAVATLKRKS